MKVWDAETGQETLTLKGHSDGVYSVAFSPDGKRIVGGGRDIKVWDASKSVPKPGVESVAVSGDGRRAVCGSWDDRWSGT